MDIYQPSHSGALKNSKHNFCKWPKNTIIGWDRSPQHTPLRWSTPLQQSKIMAIRDKCRAKQQMGQRPALAKFSRQSPIRKLTLSKVTYLGELLSYILKQPIKDRNVWQKAVPSHGLWNDLLWYILSEKGWTDLLKEPYQSCSVTSTSWHDPWWDNGQPSGATRSHAVSLDRLGYGSRMDSALLSAHLQIKQTHSSLVIS